MIRLRLPVCGRGLRRYFDSGEVGRDAEAGSFGRTHLTVGVTFQ